MDRRTFLVHIGGLAASTSPLATWIGGCTHRPAAAGVALPAGAWRTVAAVQAHLLPTEHGAPGAQQVNALAYLHVSLRAPDFDDGAQTFLMRGAEKVEQLAQQKAGSSFIDLTHEEREAVLRSFEAMDEGTRWLAQMLGYLMEAVLGDPVYGGNPDGIGWRWLDHTPGFPRPPAHKRYFLL